MLRFASSLLASAVIVFLGTTLLGATTLENGSCKVCPPPRHLILVPHPPKVIATVVAHAHAQSSSFSVHGL